ncbi:MAG: hypothetical protein ABF452_13540 [Gluconobacter potus]
MDVRTLTHILLLKRASYTLREIASLSARAAQRKTTQNDFWQAQLSVLETRRTDLNGIIGQSAGGLGNPSAASSEGNRP